MQWTALRAAFQKTAIYHSDTEELGLADIGILLQTLRLSDLYRTLN